MSTLASSTALAIHPAARRIGHLRWISRLMDNAIRLPGTNYRIGLDPVIGMIPILGDLLPALVSAYIVYESHRMGVSRYAVGRMIINVIIDILLGIVPVAGDLADFAWKANARNLALLEEELGLRSA